MSRVAFFVNDVATLTGLSSQKIRRMIKAGELKAVRAGKRVLIPKAALEDFLKNGTSHRAAQ
ncbi:MAG: DNA-binding protein [Ammonifex sp.]|jgi:excisionase family DNA binding protein|nr:MAG: DNA-binding protein [Ammonifex sp.]